jgi:hypothetical protein
MKWRSFAIFCALSGMTINPAIAQAREPQDGVMPSYRTAPPKITARIAGPAALSAALLRARGGEVFGLAPGNYSIDLQNRAFAAPVTLTSAIPDRPARIGWINLRSVSNLTFTRLEISRTAAPGEKLEAGYIAKVTGGANVVFDTNHFHGSLDNNARNDVNGLSFSGTRRAKVINNEFEQLGRGAVFGAIDDGVIANNKVHHIRSDGFDFIESIRLLIEGNSFSSFQQIPTDHPDAIQFWTANTKRPSTDIVIRSNQMLTGDGYGFQGIFLRDEKELMPFARVTIENNLIIGSNMANGIYVSNGQDVKILNNTVVSPTDDKNPVWIRTIKVGNLETSGNVADVGGNKTPQQAKINMKLLKEDTFRTLKAEDVIVPGIGYQLPK